MNCTQYQTELDYCLAQAARLLGGPARPLRLERSVQSLVLRQFRLESRHGLGHEPAMLFVDRSHRGHELDVGLECYRWQTARGVLRVVRVSFFYDAPLTDFWAVRDTDYRRFYRAIREEIRRRDSDQAPIMPEAELQRLWDHTVGFLRRAPAQLARFGVAPKRGVLLLGEPGNGKTMACRWLAAQCRRRGLEWKNVTVEIYDAARRDNEVPELFQLTSPGIILFDDFDSALLDRRTTSDPHKQSTFLTELDGVQQQSGVVYVFTSNAGVGDLDPAIRRPGRLDVILHFARPEATQRRQLITQRWHADLVGAIDVERVVADTDGFSFAELEEAKKLLVLRYLDTGRWDWTAVEATLRCGPRQPRAARPIGFQASSPAMLRAEAVAGPQADHSDPSR